MDCLFTFAGVLFIIKVYDDRVCISPWGDNLSVTIVLVRSDGILRLLQVGSLSLYLARRDFLLPYTILSGVNRSTLYKFRVLA